MNSHSTTTRAWGYVLCVNTSDKSRIYPKIGAYEEGVMAAKQAADSAETAAAQVVLPASAMLKAQASLHTPYLISPIEMTKIQFCLRS
jgi:hypothetical protein